MTALLGFLGTLLGPHLLLFNGSAILILIVFANLRGLQTARKLETTTSAALAIVFLLGVLVRPRASIYTCRMRNHCGDASSA